ncbi:FAD dependent oxidoreductase superfamily [Fusarium beomiforme]|uniref:FAD dependent oxidoreductase superfamily n=1 Tax=Fusarium beomiforme TaxID=44412 RepID=A0A9P5ADQ3_9HYPO|nr:FAD dependent oxidoreductase superfamily [Fusarium beomiforme]
MRNIVLIPPTARHIPRVAPEPQYASRAMAQNNAAGTVPRRQQFSSSDMCRKSRVACDASKLLRAQDELQQVRLIDTFLKFISLQCLNNVNLAQQAKDRLSMTAGLPSNRPTSSYWQEPPAPIASIQSNELPPLTDIAIVGSGVTGTSVAHAILNHPRATGLRVTILEARNACSGATGRNGGHLVSDTCGHFQDLVDALGVEEAVKILRFSEANIAELKGIVAQLNASEQEAVELREVNSSAVIGDKETLENGKRSLELTKSTIEETSLEYENVEDQNIMKEKFKYRDRLAVFEQKGACALWPYRLITILQKRLFEAHKSRFSIETNTPVTSISFQGEEGQSDYSYLLQTPRGVVKAQKVIHCTNGYSSHLLPNLTGVVHPVRGTVSVQYPGDSFPRLGNELSWTKIHRAYYDPKNNTVTTGLYYAQQNAKTGEIVIGGESQEVESLLSSDDSEVGPTAKEHISSIIPKMYLDVDDVKVKKVWSGIMGFTPDGMPLIGNLDKRATGRAGGEEWIAAGFNGHGMDKCWLSGQAVAKMALGEDVPLWLPESFLVNEKRLESLTLDRAIEAFVGAFAILDA